MPQFNGKIDLPDRNHTRVGRNSGFRNPFGVDGSEPKFDSSDEGSEGFVGLSGDQEGMKNLQPSVNKLLNKRAGGEEVGGKKDIDFLEKFKLGGVSKKEEKSDEAEAAAASVKLPFQEESMEAHENADYIFKKMKQTGLIPNAVAMLDGLCKDGLVHEAMKLFGLMREKGSMPEVVVYTAVVEGFCQVQKYDDAKRVFRKMQDNGIVPNAFSYTVFIRGLLNGKRMDDAVDFCVKMVENGHSPNVMTFTWLVHEFCEKKGVEEARNFISTLKRMGFLLDENAVRIYLDKNGPTPSMAWEAIFGPKKRA